MARRIVGSPYYPATVTELGISSPPPRVFQFQLGLPLVFPSLYTIAVYTVYFLHSNCLCVVIVDFVLGCRLPVALARSREVRYYRCCVPAASVVDRWWLASGNVAPLIVGLCDCQYTVAVDSRLSVAIGCWLSIVLGQHSCCVQ